MRESYLHLVVVLLCFSHLVFLNAIPLSRTRNMMLDFEGPGAPENRKPVKIEEVMVTERRLEVELNDYGSRGGYNVQTPRDPISGCEDCDP